MLVKQSQNTFIRFFDEESAYITNQVTRYDRTYNDIGADFLREISRSPRDVDDIVNRLSTLYGDSVSYEKLRSDFLRFIEDLERNKFLITGESVSDLDSSDFLFSYSLENPKTLGETFNQSMDYEIGENTQDHMLEATSRKPHLNSLQFELTSRCNERCIHCYIPNAKKNKGIDMTIDTVKRILDEYSSMGGLHVTLSGGEVFLHKDILPIIAYCREKDMCISILSNLISLEESQIPLLKEANLSLIQTSLYSMDPQIHDYITTVKGSFKKTVRSIELLVSADIPVQIACPTMKANAKGYVDVLKYAHSLRCKSHTDFIMMAQSDLCTNNLANRLSIKETEALIRDIIEHDIDYKSETLKLKPLSEETEFDVKRYQNQPLCGAGINNCCITASGDLYPCAGWQAMICGNIHQQSLKDIWEKSPQLKRIRAITHGDFPQCLDCDAKNYCSMCLVRNYNENNGDMFKINKHFCDVAFLNKKLVEEYQNRINRRDENI